MVADNYRRSDLADVFMDAPGCSGNEDTGQPEEAPIKLMIQALKGPLAIPGKQIGSQIKG